jgi:DNA modification methylase
MIKPYYQDEYCTIYNADCRDVLQQLQYDIIITDPPYGINGGIGGRSKRRAKGNYNSSFIDDECYIKSVVIHSLFNIAHCKTKVITSGFEMLHLYPQCDSFGCFFSRSATGMQRFGFADSQPILYYGKSNKQGIRPEACSFLMEEAPEKNGHPCVKPINAWKKLVYKVADKTDVILDPFMGSGTTLRAAKDFGIKSIGIELGKKYCDIAIERLRQEVLDI